MIKCELYMQRADGVKLYRTYSDAGLKIQKVGTDEVYDSAIDVEGAPYTYVETDQPCDVSEDETVAQKAQAYDILMGVSE